MKLNDHLPELRIRKAIAYSISKYKPNQAISGSIKAQATIIFAEERLQMHEANPKEGMDWEQMREKVKAKYGF